MIRPAENKRKRDEDAVNEALPSFKHPFNERQEDPEEPDAHVKEIDPESDIMFAITCLRKMAQISPDDLMVILRWLSMTPPPNKTVNDGDDSPAAAFNKICRLAYLCQSGEHEDVMENLICKISLAVEYRRVILKEADKKDASIKQYFKEDEFQLALDTGLKAMTVSFAISPRSMFGVQLMPLMGLNCDALKKTTFDQLSCLVQLLTGTGSNDKGPYRRADVPIRYRPIVDYVVERLIPGLERALSGFVRHKFISLPATLKKGIVVKKTEEDVSEEKPPSYGLLLGDTAIYLPDTTLIDDNYKSLLQGDDNHKILSCFDGKVSIDLVKHRQLKDKYPIGPSHIAAFKSYEEYWKIAEFKGPRSANVYPGFPRKPSSEMSDEEWAQVNPFIAYWATYTTSEGDVVTVDGETDKTINTHSIDFLVPLTDEMNASLDDNDGKHRRNIPKEERTKWDESYSSDEESDEGESDEEESDEEDSDEEQEQGE